MEEDDAENLLTAMEEELLRRRFGPVVRLEVEETIRRLLTYGDLPPLNAVMLPLLLSSPKNQEYRNTEIRISVFHPRVSPRGGVFTSRLGGTPDKIRGLFAHAGNIFM